MLDLHIHINISIRESFQPRDQWRNMTPMPLGFFVKKWQSKVGYENISLDYESVGTLKSFHREHFIFLWCQIKAKISIFQIFYNLVKNHRML